MPELISNYVAELKTQLSIQMNPYEAQLISEEVHSHLLDRFEAYQSLGSDPQTAELEAIQSFGLPAEIASEYKHVEVKKEPWTLAPLPSNAIYFASFVFVAFFERLFVGDFNLPIVAIWLVLPALSKKHPWIGLLAGTLLVELCLSLPRGGMFTNIAGILAFYGFSFVSWGIGWLVRYCIAAHRAKSRNELRKQ